MGIFPTSQLNQIPSEIDSNKDSSNPIFDIIQSLQSKLNESEEKNNHSVNLKDTKKDLSEIDFPKILEMLNKNGINKNNDVDSSQNVSGSNFDISTIMNLQKTFSSINKVDPRRDLLYSLKPFLRETRQKNIDTYITLLGVINALNIFSSKDSD